ncbi:DUF4405 domain-containing protein [Desulfoluna butyratoxydans]|uniref:Flavinylation-associated cytochrome domain-containing protein n=1 Tax=Desulfoluna butyratoxydans TaxID=231438 RepID=A0A4U8YQU5_9BACT|nr:DUF4405 domain-containing protein [Desulfoluna butyratoxydans]VFQ45817.1 domain of unknown function duf4405 [Desulfoluna butyratoxydans]
MQRPKKMWGVNVALFVLGGFLAVTGLINAWILPHGYEAKGSVLVDIRHALTGFHEWAGILFIVAVAIHLVLHGTYIRKNMAAFGWFGWMKK